MVFRCLLHFSALGFCNFMEKNMHLNNLRIGFRALSALIAGHSHLLATDCYWCGSYI